MTQPYRPITKEMAAQILSVSKRTIDNLISNGLLPPPIPIGRRVYWHPDVFYEALDQRLRSIEVAGAATRRGRPRAKLK